jgi:hypothetical protein
LARYLEGEGDFPRQTFRQVIVSNAGAEATASAGSFRE